MKTAGYFITAISELTTCVKDGKYNLYCRKSCFFLDIYRNSTSIINYGNGIVRINGHINGIAVSCQRLIHCVIYDLINQMMESAGRCAANIHTWALSYRLKSFQNLNLICSVLLSHVLYLPFFFSQQPYGLLPFFCSLYICII